ncbi:MAG: aldo/keto reductase [Acidimicrobiia bacterium]
MHYAILGPSGLKVSRIAVGASPFGTGEGRRPYAIGPDEALPIVQRALDLGINFFDTAESYSYGTSEEVLGQCLARCGVRREDVVIASKVGNYPPPDEGSYVLSMSRKHIMHAIDDSLRRLNTDYIDLYQIHRLYPGPPYEETLEALHDCVHAGKVRYLGACTMYAWQLEHLISLQERNGWSKFISLQNYYNLTYREEEREMLPLCEARGLGVLPWGALSGGFLGGNASRDGTKHTARAATDVFKTTYPPSEQDFDIQDRVRDVAQQTGRSMAQVALAWLLSKPAITMSLVGITKLPQLDDIAASLTLELEPEMVAHLEAPYQPLMPRIM